MNVRRSLLQKLLAAVLLPFLGSARADEESAAASGSLADLNLEQLMQIKVDTVYGASKHEQKVTQAPSSVSIVTADEIKKFGHRTLADVLRSVRGMYITDDRNYSYTGMRGFLRPGDYNSRVLVLMDGHRLNDSIYDSAYPGTDGAVDVDLIDRVEVIRGPSSSIYGSSAFFGVINIVTRSASQIDGVEASAEGGSFETYKGRFTYGKLFKNDLSLLLSGTYYTSENQKKLYYPEFDQRISSDPRARSNGIVRDQDEEESVHLRTTLGYHDFTLSGYLTARSKEVPTAAYGTLFNDGRAETTDVRGYVDLKYDHSFSEDLRLTARAYYDYFGYDGGYPFNYAPPGDPPLNTLYRDEAVGEWAGAEWQLTSKLFDRHTILAGGEYRESFHEHQFNFDDKPRFYYLKDDRNSRTLGLYAQGEIGLLTNLVLNVGVRYDHYFGSFGGTFNPRIGLIYSPWEFSTFKALYGQAFRAPNPYERYYSTLQQTRPELDPEKVRTYELAYEQYLGRKHRLTIAGYFYEVEDLISQVSLADNSFYFDNVDSANARGIEFEVEGKYDWGLLARASYAFQRSENEVTGNELSSSPRHLAKANFSVPLYKDKVFAGLELQYNGSSRTVSGGRADDFFLANLTLFSQRLLPNLEVSASLYNLFDTRYGYPGGEEHAQDVILQNGRSFRIKLTYRF